jgi:hypothetical protein
MAKRPHKSITLEKKMEVTRRMEPPNNPEMAQDNPVDPADS